MAITIKRPIWNRSHGTIYKPDTTNEVKSLKATTFTIEKVGRTIIIRGAIDSAPKIISHFRYFNIIFADC